MTSQNFDQRGTVIRILTKSFLEQDDATEIFFRAAGREQKRSIGASSFFGRIDADRLEALGYRRQALISSKNTFARLHDLGNGGLKFVLEIHR